MTVPVPPTTEITREGHKQVYDRAALEALLDSAAIGHVGVVLDDGSPLVVPTAVVRDGAHLLLHGSTGSPWMRRAAGGAPLSVAVTAFDGVIVARSAFESSFRYRSAVLFGTAHAVTDQEDKVRALDRFTDALIPGRVAEVRRPSAKELAATLVLALPIERWSLKVSAGWPGDGPDDVAGPTWAGVVPARVVYDEPRPAPDLRAGIDVPASARALADPPTRPDRATSGGATPPHVAQSVGKPVADADADADADAEAGSGADAG